MDYLTFIQAWKGSDVVTLAGVEVSPDDIHELLVKLIAIYKSKGYHDIEVTNDGLIVRHGVGVKGAESWIRYEPFLSILADKDWIMSYDTFRKN